MKSKALLVTLVVAVGAAAGVTAAAGNGGLPAVIGTWGAIGSADGSSSLELLGFGDDGALLACADLSMGTAQIQTSLSLWPYGAREEYPVLPIGDGRYVVQGSVFGDEPNGAAGLCIGWAVNPARTLLSRVKLDNSCETSAITVEVVDLTNARATSILNIPVRPFLENLSSHVTWGADDTLYFDLPDERGWGIWTWRSGGQAAPLLEMARHPELSSDGKYFAYQSMLDPYYPEAGPVAVVDLETWSGIPGELPAGTPVWVVGAMLAVLTPDGSVTIATVGQDGASIVGTRHIGGVLAYPYSDSRGLHVFSIGADSSVPSLRSITVPAEAGH